MSTENSKLIKKKTDEGPASEDYYVCALSVEGVPAAADEQHEALASGGTVNIWTLKCVRGR